MNKKIFAAALVCIVSTATQASEIDFTDGILATPNQVDDYQFNVGSLGGVDLYTTSNFPTNPLLTLWKQSGADWQLVASNDTRADFILAEGNNAWDAKIPQVILGAGLYDVSVSWSGNTAVGTLYSSGFSNNGNNGNALFDSYNPYQLTITGDVSAVPLPATVWMFGAGLMGFLRWSKKRA